MLNIWQRLAASLFGWKYALVTLNRGKGSEHTEVFRVYQPSRGPSRIRVYHVVYKHDVLIDGKPVIKSQYQSWERLTDYDYEPLTRGLP